MDPVDVDHDPHELRRTGLQPRSRPAPGRAGPRHHRRAVVGRKVRARRSNYVYGSTKAGLDLFAQGLSDSLVGTGARCVVVRPGFVRSRMTEGLDPAPFSTDPATVARATVDAPRTAWDVVSVPAPSDRCSACWVAPRGLWRRIAGDR